ncbi:MAG: hypothetical protein KGL58_02985, partial [Pseudomonadota bacterium]|nr:hypothetical protein [Pseudomonadota bacterium]
RTIGSGYAVAIQSLFENTSMLIMVGLYTLAIKFSIPINFIITYFGFLVFLGIYWVGYLLKTQNRIN